VSNWEYVGRCRNVKGEGQGKWSGGGAVKRVRGMQAAQGEGTPPPLSLTKGERHQQIHVGNCETSALHGNLSTCSGWAPTTQAILRPLTRGSMCSRIGVNVRCNRSRTPNPQLQYTFGFCLPSFWFLYTYGWSPDGHLCVDSGRYNRSHERSLAIVDSHPNLYHFVRLASWGGLYRDSEC